MLIFLDRPSYLYALGGFGVGRAVQGVRIGGASGGDVDGAAAHITGAEELKGWTKVEGSVYTARVSNKIFGDYNPYTTLVSGDWFIAYFVAHTGDVFLNGKSM